MLLEYESPYLSEEHLLFRESVREFCDREIRPRAAQHDRDERIDPQLLRLMGEQGFLGFLVPEELGGSGGDTLGFTILSEEINRVCASTWATFGAHAGIGTYGLLWGAGDEVKKRVLPKVASGEWLAAYALTEAGAGSDAAAMKTRAVHDGDDWVLNGEKMWITNGPIAQVFTVFAVTDPEKGGHGGVTAFLVERGMPGFESGAPEKKMGIKGSLTSTLSFKSVRVPDANRLSEVGRGFPLALKILDKGRTMLGAGCLGVAREAFEMSVKFAAQRQQFGKPIAEFQFIQGYLADMASEIYAMDQMVYHAAWLDSRGKPATMPASMVKLYCTERASWITNKAVQIHGGMGYSAELPIERMYRDGRICEIFEGTNEIQRLVIAREIMKAFAKATGTASAPALAGAR
jgi:alkylation response protein AidB-like acyl-CoA dehydrogenase